MAVRGYTIASPPIDRLPDDARRFGEMPGDPSLPQKGSIALDALLYQKPERFREGRLVSLLRTTGYREL